MSFLGYKFNFDGRFLYYNLTPYALWINLRRLDDFIKITLEDTITIKVHLPDKLLKPPRHSVRNIQRSHSRSYNNRLSDLLK